MTPRTKDTKVSPWTRTPPRRCGTAGLSVLILVAPALAVFGVTQRFRAWPSLRHGQFPPTTTPRDPGVVSRWPEISQPPGYRTRRFPCGALFRKGTAMIDKVLSAINHRRLGRELPFLDSDPLGAGLPNWLPAGAATRGAIEDYIREVVRRGLPARLLAPTGTPRAPHRHQRRRVGRAAVARRWGDPSGRPVREANATGSLTYPSAGDLLDRYIFE